jgi:hypothetical protein
VLEILHTFLDTADPFVEVGLTGGISAYGYVGAVFPTAGAIICGAGSTALVVAAPATTH